jgi:hypothetical protein
VGLWDFRRLHKLALFRAHQVPQVFLVLKWRVRLFLDLLAHLDLQEILEL